MFCKYCGSVIEEDSVFCKECGKKIQVEKERPKSAGHIPRSNKPAEEFDTSNAIEIEIPGRSKGVLKFSSNSLFYKDKTLKYSNVDAISCQIHTTYYNFLPGPTSLWFIFYGPDYSIKVNFGHSFKIPLKEQKERWSQIFAISKKLIVPLIVDKMVDKIVNKDETITIYPLSFNKEGISKKRFLRKKEWILWKDMFYKPALIKGCYLINKKEDGELKPFSAVPLGYANGIVIPELVESLYSIYYK